jgi:hypothetical protein
LNWPTSPWSEPNTTAPIAPASVCPFRSGDRGSRLAFPKARAQSQFHGAIVVAQRAHRFLVLSDARSGQGFHRADDGLEISGTADLSAQAGRGVAHDFSLRVFSGFGLTFGFLRLDSSFVSASAWGSV